MNSISINGVNISSSGDISIRNGKVIVNGVDVTPDSKQISIIVNGDTNKIDVDACESLHVTGKVGSVKTMSGDVNVNGDIEGPVSTMSGDVDAKEIHGSVKSMSGDIKTYNK